MKNCIIIIDDKYHCYTMVTNFIKHNPCKEGELNEF